MEKKLDRGTLWSLILMGVTAILIAVTGVIYKQSVLRICPLFVSLVIGLLQSRVNRFAPLLGGINSLAYAAVYVYYGLFASAVYAVVVSCPLQLVTFWNWSKRPYGESVILKKMTAKQRTVVSAAFLLCWVGLFIILQIMGSSYQLWDNTITLLGILTTVLNMLAYVEYAPLMILGCICNIGLYIAMIVDTPEQVTYLIYGIYTLICSVKGLRRAIALYKEQNEPGKEERKC
ncbi:MAG: nicotinamide mononucleotide transporter [Clostridia bacterium]|nr:nicotinamide mononucleotide transporter [Clostridia bacterium]